MSGPVASCTYCGADIASGPIFTTTKGGCYSWLKDPVFGRVTFHKKGALQMADDVLPIRVNAQDLAQPAEP